MHRTHLLSPFILLALLSAACGAEQPALEAAAEALTVSASGDDGNVAANAVDGDLSTRWSCLADGCWLQLDLGEPRAFDTLEIAWYRGEERASRFELLAGQDEASLAPIFSGQSSGTTAGLEPYRFAATEARLVRVVVHGNTQNDWASISELRIPALGTLGVSAVTDQTGKDYTSRLLDNRTLTRWNCTSQPCRLLVDLGEERAVSGLKLSWYRAGTSYDFRVAYSPDGTNFGPPAALRSSGLTKSEEYALPLGLARWVGLEIDLGAQNSVSLTELRVFGSTRPAQSGETPADTTPPTISAPADLVRTATGTLTQVALGTPIVRDDTDPAPAVTNDAPSAGFPVGDTTVTWRATDASGNSATALQRVTIAAAPVADTTPPTISAPADLSRTATGTLTQVALGTPVVRDDTDPAPAVTNDAPAAGFPVGDTTVTWRATDASGNSATDTQRVTIAAAPVADTTPPTISAPADLVRTATGTLTQVALGTPTVRDETDATPTVTNDAPAAGFPVGVTTVTWRAVDDAGNAATDTQLVTINPASTTPDGGTDSFGTKAIYASATNGRTWSAKWNSNPRTLSAGQVDLQDPEFWMRGSSQTLQIFGDGTAKSAGETIRFYLGDRSKARKWQNVEFTMYSMRVSEQSDATGTAGFAVETRTDDGHTSSTTALNDEGLDKRCEGHAYAYALRYDGRAVLQKELKHPTYTSTISKNVWNGGTLPKNQWIGMKVITRNVANGVKLEIWRDLTDGANGGTWEKIQEYTDAGGWSISSSVAATCNIEPDHVITTAEPFIIFRNDNVVDQRYKKVSIREIAP